MARGRRRAWSVAFALLAALAGSLPAHAVDPTDFTGDITKPTVRSFTVSPTGADVTHGPASFDVTLHVTDDWSGVTYVSLNWMNIHQQGAYEIQMTLTSGTELDGVWTGTFTIAEDFPPGRYRFFMAVADRVGNGQSLPPDELDRRGFASGVDITSANPDVSPPRLTSVSVSPSTLDVRDGPATLTVEVAAEDPSGVQYVSPSVLSRMGTAGGRQASLVTRVSGTDTSGVWRGTVTLPEHTPGGRWKLSISLYDRFDNIGRHYSDTLKAEGFVDGFDVLSHEDVTPPKLEVVTFEPVEVNVHDADQTVRVRVKATDDITGVERYWGDTPYHNIQLWAHDLLTTQGVGVGGLPLVSGTATDGVFEGSFTVRKSSATGAWPVRVWGTDEVDNSSYVQEAELVATGTVPTLLVYNVPLPPIPVGADPADGLVTVRWSPPTDDRGAAVTAYVVREARTGKVVRTSGSARSAAVTGLSNDVAHTFTVTAVNKAGESDPSSALKAVPRAGSGYWMVGAGGAVYGFGEARWHGNALGGGTPAVDIEPVPARTGYWVVDAAGRVSAHGSAPALGSAGGLAPGESVTSLSATPSGRGYRLFTDRGRVLPFGDASFLGDMSHVVLNGPVLDSVSTPSGQGYFMVAADGGVFSFGDARFAGSMASVRLNAPVQSLVPDPDGSGYWLVAADGGIFAFEAPFLGSMGSVPLNRPVTGMVGSRTGGGYLMVAEDGGIFTFGDVPFRGSLGSTPPAVPITSVAAY